MDEIKRLYDEANVLYKQAIAILDEYKGKESIPAEKKNEYDALMEKFDNLTERAQMLEAAEKRKKVMEQVPEGNRPGVFNSHQTPEAELDAKAKQVKEAKRKYWLTGDDSELKALSVGSQAAGGYLSEDTFNDGVLMGLNAMVTMRQIATVLPPVPVGSLITPSAIALDDAENNTETGEVVFDSVEPFSERRLTPHEYDKGILVSNAFLRNPRFDVEKWVREQGTLACGRKEENDFINGAGNGKPLGLLQTPSLPTYTGVTSNEIFGDDILNWIYTLPAAYAASPKTRILCNRAFVRKVRTISKANTGTAFTNYIWQPALGPGQKATIENIEYALSDKFDDGLTSDAWEDSAKIAVVGDFSYYWIVDAVELYIQRLNEAYAATKQVGFIFTKATDGMCVMPEAFVALVVKA